MARSGRRARRAPTVGWRVVRQRTLVACSNVSRASMVRSSQRPGPSPTTMMVGVASRLECGDVVVDVSGVLALVVVRFGMDGVLSPDGCVVWQNGMYSVPYLGSPPSPHYP